MKAPARRAQDIFGVDTLHCWLEHHVCAAVYLLDRTHQLVLCGGIFSPLTPMCFCLTLCTMHTTANPQLHSCLNPLLGPKMAHSGRKEDARER